jgi:hypothetical protein
VFICEKMPAPTEALEVDAARKIALLFSLILILFSCIKLEENDKKYSARKLQKMLEGTWELTDYQIDGVSYLDTLLKVNTRWNCKTYKFTQWKNTSKTAKPKSGNYLKTGEFGGNCQTSPGSGYDFNPKKKKLGLGGNYFIDSIYYFDTGLYNVIKLEDNQLIINDNRLTDHFRQITFIKK